MFIELHSRSAFSFLEGASLPEDLIAACTHLNMPAMALLDRDGVYGAPRFYMAAKKAGIKAHMGAEVTSEISDFRLKIEDLKPGKSESICNLKSKICNFFRLPLLVSSRAGYQNLCRLITKMKLRAQKGEGAVRKDELQEHAAGLICLTGGDDGPLATALARGGMEEARRSVECLTGIFGHGNVYVELQRHFHREEEARNRAAIEIARSLQLPLLATNGVCYATPQERELCDVFTCIRNHCTLATAGRLLARNSERHLKSPQQMQQLFADLPEAIANTVELSSRLEFTLEDLGYEFPRYPVPEGETMMSFLRERTGEGLQQRYGRADAGLQKPRPAPDRARTGADRKAQARRLFPDRLGHRPLLPRARTFWCRAAARPPTAPSVIRWASPRSIRSAWNCCSNAFFPKSAASGPTSISICPAATSASAPFNMSTSATANSAPP